MSVESEQNAVMRESLLYIRQVVTDFKLRGATNAEDALDEIARSARSSADRCNALAAPKPVSPIPSARIVGERVLGTAPKKAVAGSLHTIANAAFPCSCGGEVYCNVDIEGASAKKVTLQGQLCEKCGKRYTVEFSKNDITVTDA